MCSLCRFRVVTVIEGGCCGSREPLVVKCAVGLGLL